MLISKNILSSLKYLLFQVTKMQQTHDADEWHAWFWVLKLKQQKVFDPSEFSNNWKMTKVA